MAELADEIDDFRELEALGQDFLDRQRRGESVSVEGYARSNPRLSAKILEFFPAMEAMERFKSCNAVRSGGACDLNLEPFEQLGDFRILREIGRGGMGVVYEADQQSLQRRVAVKVLPRKSLSDSKRLNRFHREARTAARLHHTNIVQVHGVGEQDGMHYFVMQRIQGTPLDQWIDAQQSLAGQNNSRVADTDQPNSDSRSSASDGGSRGDVDESWNGNVAGSMDWRAVADIGIQVAEALQYAHDQGVLHRDIKPSNLLMDHDGRVWVTDFGLATVIETEALGDSEEVAGTLRFMAPEQLGGYQDPRSDLYSLGLTLYEMVTLTPAFTGSNRSALVAKIVKGELVPPRQLRSRVPRDLEAIILKATAVDPKRRYTDAAEMADDLRRLMATRTVSARRSGPVSKLLRWARRDPAVASLSAALLITAALSFALISAKWRDAVEESRRAENNLSLALESMDQILARFGSSWMAQPIATTSGIESGVEFQLAVSDHSVSVLEDALLFYDKFEQQNPTDPRLHRDIAKVHRRVADIYQRLGQFAQAEQAYRRSLAFLTGDRARQDTQLAIEKASTLNQLGTSMLLTSRFQEAQSEFARALNLLSDPQHKENPESQAELARILTNLGRVQWLTMRRDDAVVSHCESVRILEDLVRKHPENAAYRVALARAYRNHYELAAFGNRGSELDQLRLSGIEILDKLVVDYPDVPDFQCELGEMLAAGFGPRDRESDAQRVSDLQRAIDLTRELTATHPSIPRYRAVLARSLNVLAGAHGMSRPEKSAELYAESVEIHQSLVQAFSEVPAYHLFLAMTLSDQGNQLHRNGNHVAASSAFSEAIAAQHEYLRLRPSYNRFGKMMLSHLYKNLAETLASSGMIEEAEQARQRATEYRGTRSGTSRRRDS